MKNALKTDVALTAYYGHLYSIVAYEIILWDGAHIQEVCVLNNRGIRLSNNLKIYEVCRGWFRKLILLTFRQYLWMSVFVLFLNFKTFFIAIVSHQYDIINRNMHTYPLCSTVRLEKDCLYRYAIFIIFHLHK